MKEMPSIRLLSAVSESNTDFGCVCGGGADMRRVLLQSLQVRIIGVFLFFRGMARNCTVCAMPIFIVLFSSLYLADLKNRPSYQDANP